MADRRGRHVDATRSVDQTLDVQQRLHLFLMEASQPRGDVREARDDFEELPDYFIAAPVYRSLNA